MIGVGFECTAATAYEGEHPVPFFIGEMAIRVSPPHFTKE
jgi:hypothetical protein